MCRDELAPLVTPAEEEESFPRGVLRRWGELGLRGVRLSLARRALERVRAVAP